MKKNKSLASLEAPEKEERARVGGVCIEGRARSLISPTAKRGTNKSVFVDDDDDVES